jgi:cobaltochelatase CobS
VNSTCKYCGKTGLQWRFKVLYEGQVRDKILFDPSEVAYHYMCDAFKAHIAAQNAAKGSSATATAEVGTAAMGGFKLNPSIPIKAPDVVWAGEVVGRLEKIEKQSQQALDLSLATTQEWAGIGAEFNTVKQASANLEDTFKVQTHNLQQSFQQALATIDQKKEVVITVKTETTEIKLEQRMHEKFPHLVKLLPLARKAGQIVFLTGEPSSGKTAAIAYAAKALNLPFWTQSMTMLTSLSDLEGFVSGHGNYVESPLWQAARPDGQGGIVLLDEIDASNANALVGLNSYGANEWVTFPNGMTFQKHPKCYIVAAGNTIGSGADTRFVGRNELDMATRDRFVYLQWDIDWGLVSYIATQKMGSDDWARKCKVIHDSVEKHHIEWVASARLVFFGLEAFQDGYTEAEVLDMKLWPHLSEDQRRQVETDLVNADVAIHGAVEAEMAF